MLFAILSAISKKMMPKKGIFDSRGLGRNISEQSYQGFIQSSNYVSGIPGATQYINSKRRSLRIAEKFKSIMLSVGFPGVSTEDNVVLDPHNWKPVVVHTE